MKGGDLFKLQKILGHKSVQMTMRYAHLAPDAFAGDYARLGAATPGEQAVIVELPGKMDSTKSVTDERYPEGEPCWQQISNS